MNREPAIVVREVVKRFPGMDKPALNAVSGEIASGGITGLVGPDGAGKSTLLRLLVGLLRADQGQARVHGFDAAVNADRIHAIAGYMPQKFGLYEDLSVMENLRLYADLRGVSGALQQEKFARLLAFTNLAPFSKRLAGKLSGGMKQKLGLACALLGEPKVLLLDEPSVGVDPISRRELWSMVEQLVDDGLAVVWSTSYLDEAERCHEVILLNEGEALYAGPPGNILRRVRGRVWKLDGIAPDRRRDLLMSLLGRPWVTDAVLQGRSLRVVTAPNTTPPDVDAGMEERLRRPNGLRPFGIPARGMMPLDPHLDAAAIDSFESASQDLKASEKERGEKEGEVPAGEEETKSGEGEAGETPAATGSWSQAEARFEDAFIDILGGGPDGRSLLGDALQTKPDSGAPTVEARGLCKRFGDFTAVHDNSFRIMRGEIFGLLGPNGAGKSTTFKMLCGLLKPSSGSASIMGIDLARSSSLARSRIGYMAQKFSLYSALSVMQNLRFFAGVYGLSGKLREERIEMVVSLFRLGRRLQAGADTLPLGYKQRLALACAVMHQPDVLFLDEPTSGVDPVTRREFWMHINAMVRKGVTVMVTTHFMDEAEYCDRIALIYHGKSIASGTPDELKAMARSLTFQDSALQSADEPDPSLEDAFIALVRQSDEQSGKH